MKHTITAISILVICILASGCQNPPILATETKPVPKRELSKQDIHSCFAAVKRGDKTAVQEYLDQGIGINVRNNELFGGKTPLMVAAKRMNLKMAKFLLDNGAKVNILDGQKLHTPLTESCRVKKENTCRQMIELLIQHGATVDTFYSNDKKDSSANPLLTALQYNNIEAADTLIEHGADFRVNKIGEYPMLSPLQTTIANFQNDYAKKLIAKGAMDKRQAAVAAMEIAINGSNLEMIRYLVDQGVDVNISIENAGNPLILACSNEKSTVIECLLSKGADVNYKGENGETPLHMAAKMNKLDAAKVLLENGAKINIKNQEGLISI